MFKLETAVSGPLSISGLLLSGHRGRYSSCLPGGGGGQMTSSGQRAGSGSDVCLKTETFG